MNCINITLFYCLTALKMVVMADGTLSFSLGFVVVGYGGCLETLKRNVPTMKSGENEIILFYCVDFSVQE